MRLSGYGGRARGDRTLRAGGAEEADELCHRPFAGLKCCSS